MVLNRAKVSFTEVNWALELWMIKGRAKTKVMKVNILISVFYSLKKAMIP